MSSYKETLEYIESLHLLGVKPGLERINVLLEALGHPELAFPTVVVAGTNGKGSTASFISSVMGEAGRRVGLYTSPHLVSFNERIRVSGRPIGKTDLARAADRLRELDPGSGVTYFEFVTSLAFEHFRARKVDLAVLEVGMGGRLDATNTASPLVSVITNVGTDHARHLGETIEEIAREKAGVIKPGAPVVTTETDPRPLGVIKKAAEGLGSPVYRLGRDFHITPADAGGFDYRGISTRLSGLKPLLPGPHQYANAAAALAAVEVAGKSSEALRAGPEEMKQGIRKARWPGRLEVVRRRPLLVLDCAHNIEGARALARALEGFKRKRLVLVLGMMADKDLSGIAGELVSAASLVVLTSPQMDRAAKTGELQRVVSPHGVEIKEEEEVGPAVDLALSEAAPEDMVLVTGSIFTVAEAKRHLSGSPA